MFRIALALVLIFALVGGCGGPSGSGSQRVQPVQTQPSDAIRSALQSIAQTGELGSEVLTIQENIEKLRSSDPAKADALAQDLQQLQTAGAPEKIKAKAAEMLQKL